MCKKKCNIQLSGLSFERSVEHLRQDRSHSWMLWNCTNNMHKYVFKPSKKKKKKTRRKVKWPQAELSALGWRGLCPFTALPQPSAPQYNLLCSDWSVTVHWCILLCSGINTGFLKHEDC